MGIVEDSEPAVLSSVVSFWDSMGLSSVFLGSHFTENYFKIIYQKRFIIINKMVHVKEKMNNFKFYIALL